MAVVGPLEAWVYGVVERLKTNGTVSEEKAFLMLNEDVSLLTAGFANIAMTIDSYGAKPYIMAHKAEINSTMKSYVTGFSEEEVKITN